MEKETLYPYVYVTRRKDFPGGWEFYCKYCKTKHTHGEGLGHRWAHCHEYKSPYRETGYILTTDSRFENKTTIEYIPPLFRDKRNYPLSWRHSLYKQYNYRCVECGATNQETTLHIDHIIPISKGGKTDIKNMQVLCRDCNLGKGNKIW